MTDVERDPIREAIRTFRWNTVSNWLREQAASSSPEAALIELIERCAHSGHLILKRRSKKQARSRDDFLDAAIGYGQQHACEDATKKLVATVDAVRLIERAYDEILKFLSFSDVAKLAPGTQTWAILGRLVTENRIMEKQLIDTGFKKRLIFDPLSVHARNESGDMFRPDSVLGAVVEIVSSALTMFAYQHGWFDKAGRIVIPERVEVTEEDEYKAGSTIVAGQAWRLLDHAQERWRFFGGAVREDVLEVRGKQIPAVVFEGEYGLDLLDTVAHERLERIFAETSLKSQLSPSQPRVDRNTTMLAPSAFISAEEAHAALVLCHMLHFDVCEDDSVYAGLSLREWLRGYSYLALVCAERKQEGDTFTSWLPEQLEDALQGHGLASERAKEFIERATFGRGSADLFDAPLLLSQDGRYWCVVDVVTVTNIPRVVLSNISVYGASIGRKGKALERRLRDVFDEQGLTCRGFRGRRGDEEYECDGALVWENKLFLFECKNRSLSGSKPSRLYRFINENLHAMKQLQRLRGAVVRFPDLLTDALPDHPPYDEVVLCVVNGLPFSVPGEVHGCYVSDASALQRLFEGGVNLQVPFKFPGGPTVIWRRRLKELWAGERCASDDLIAQLRSPFQVETLLDGYHLDTQPWPLSADMALVTSHVRMKERSLEQLCAAYGVELSDFAEELEAFADQMSRLKATAENPPLDADNQMPSSGHDA